jgi:hypothetical protein
VAGFGLANRHESETHRISQNYFGIFAPIACAVNAPTDHSYSVSGTCPRIHPAYTGLTTAPLTSEQNVV